MSSKAPAPIQQQRLYEMVAERIYKDYVLNAAPGDRLQTETEFAAIYRVSVPTVREALRSLVQAGYLHRRQGSGTYRSETPGGTAASGAPATKHVAIVTPLDLTDPGVSRHYIQIAFQTAKDLLEAGQASQIYYGETVPGTPRTFDDTQLCRDIEAGRVSAAVVISETDSVRPPYQLALHAGKLPIVSSDACSTSTGRNRAIHFLETAVETLMKHNRRKIACVGFGAGVYANESFDFRRLVAAKGGITDDCWIVGDLHPSTSGSGYSLVREIWTTGKIKPDGLILCDDVFFHDAAIAIRELGIQSPDQLLVVTYRNKGERLHAGFPYIELQYDAKEVAAQLADNVVGLLAGREAQPIVCDPVLADPFDADSEANEEAFAGRQAQD